jgi:hypothetical protein
LQALKDQIRPWDEKIAALDVEVAKFDAEASFADRGLDRTRVRGCGNEVCKPAQKNAAERRKKIADIQKELKPKHDELTRIAAEIEVFQKTLAGLREQAAYLSGRGEQTNAISAPVAFDLGSGLQGLDEARRGVRKRPVLEHDQSHQGLVRRIAAVHTGNEARKRPAREHPMRSAIRRRGGFAHPPR